MKPPPPLSPEVEALLAPHRQVLPLAPSVEVRVLARARAVAEAPEPAAFRARGWSGRRAAAAAAVIALSAAAYAAHGCGGRGLVEEREALRVKSLAGLGRQDDARRAAAEFHARFPRSVLLTTFERMTDTER